MAVPSIKIKIDAMIRRIIDFIDLATHLAELALVITMIWFFTKLIRMFFGDVPGVL